MSEVAYTKEERMKGIGGSDARKIVSGDWYDLWLEKTGKKIYQIYQMNFQYS